MLASISTTFQQGQAVTGAGAIIKSFPQGLINIGKQNASNASGKQTIVIAAPRASTPATPVSNAKIITAVPRAVTPSSGGQFIVMASRSQTTPNIISVLHYFLLLNIIFNVLALYT